VLKLIVNLKGHDISKTRLKQLIHHKTLVQPTNHSTLHFLEGEAS